MATDRRATRRNLPSAQRQLGLPDEADGTKAGTGVKKPPSFQGWLPATETRAAAQFLDLKRRRMRLSCGGP